jgi:hypothetical protein
VFHFTRAGEVLGQIAMGGVDDPRVLVVGDAAHARGTGVEGKNEFHRGQDNDGDRVDIG